MLRKITAVLALALVVACVSAKEYKGTVTKVDSAKKTLTVKVGDDEKTFVYSDKTEFIGRKGKAVTQEQLPKMAEKAGDRGMAATIVTEEKDDKEVVKDGNPVASKVTFMGGKKKS
jgi:hypothetical protein